MEVIEPTSLETFTIRAAGARRNSGSMALVTVTTPNTLVSYTSRRVASVVWLGSPAPSPRAMPALLIRMSSRPYFSSICSAACRTDFSSVTSSGRYLTSAPPARSCRSAVRPLASSLAPARTVMPLAPSSLAVSSPMPLLAPVIKAMVVMPTIFEPGGDRRESIAEAGISGTTLLARGYGKLGVPAHVRHHLLERDGERPGPGDVPAQPQAAAAARRCRLARGRAAAHARSSPPGGRSARRNVSGLLHPAGTGPRPPPVPSDPRRSRPRADPHSRRARVPVPRRGGESSAGGQPVSCCQARHPQPDRQPARYAGLRGGRQVRHPRLEHPGDALHRRLVRIRRVGPEHDPLDLPPAARRDAVDRSRRG